MRLRLPIGEADFRNLRRDGSYYVDKTHFIAKVLDLSAQVLLIPRPRRFGKTLALSMLRYYFEPSEEDRSDLFNGLSIWSAGPEYRAHFQRKPVIHLTFKDVKHSTFRGCIEAVALEVASQLRTHDAVLPSLSGDERALFDRISSREASDAELASALRAISTWVGRAQQERVVVLIDEYDTPIHSAFVHGYYDEAVSFFRNFLSGGLKDNPHLFRGVLTGVLRIAKESIFSGLNNLSVYSTLRPELSDAFGFTEPEVEGLCRTAGGVISLADIRAWYDGYRFGKHLIYNPWSVLNYLASEDREFRPYWVATGSDDVLRELFLERGLGVHADIEDLLRGERIEKPIEENIVLREVRHQPDALWSFLVFSGYLSAEEARSDGHSTRAKLAIPNFEVRVTYERIFRSWLARALGGESTVQAMTQALLAGQIERFEELLDLLLRTSLSHHDVGGPGPEAVYQAFVVGLLLHLQPHYEVRSNRESGLGRYDVMIAPRSPAGPGVILELKVLDARRDGSVDRALDAALLQVHEKAYATDLRDRGADPIHELAAVFDGKRVWVRAAPK